MEDILFLSMDDVLLLHTDTIDIDGGSHGVRDHGLLDAAVAMPRQQFGGDYLHEDFPAMATAYMFHIAQNHPFVDGNKRVAFLSIGLFLALNGYRLKVDQVSATQVMFAAAAGELEEKALAAWIRTSMSANQLAD